MCGWGCGHNSGGGCPGDLYPVLLPVSSVDCTTMEMTFNLVCVFVRVCVCLCVCVCACVCVCVVNGVVSVVEVYIDWRRSR